MGRAAPSSKDSESGSGKVQAFGEATRSAALPHPATPATRWPALKSLLPGSSTTPAKSTPTLNGISGFI